MKVHLALALVQLLFGLWPVAGTAVMRELSPAALIGFRLALGAPLLALGAGILRERPPALSDLGRLALLAALGISANQLLYAEGLFRAGPINAGVTILLVPPLTLAFAALAGQERPRLARVSGVVLALLGAAILLRAERFDLSDARTTGNLMLIANSTVYALYIVLARPVIARLGALRTMAWVFVLGALEALPLTLGPLAAVPWGALPAWAWGSLAFILFGATLATYLLNAWALRRAESSLVGAYVYLQPVIAMLSAWTILGLAPGSRALVSALIIVAGVALSADLPRALARARRPES